MGPVSLCDPGFDAAVGKAPPLHRIAAAYGVAHVPVPVQRQPDHIRQGIHGSPGHTLGFGVAEHAVGSLVRAAVGAIAAGYGLVRPDGLQCGLTAARPAVPFQAADAVADHGPVPNILLIAGGTGAAVMGRVLPAFPVQQRRSGLVGAGTVPVGLSQHLFAERGEVFIGERDIDSLAHCCSLSLLSVSSMRPCSCASTDLSFSGMGSPRWAAFSSMDTDSLER